MHYTLKESDKEKAEGSNGAGALQQKLLESRSIVISGEINQELAQKVITQMILLQSVSNDPIKLYINSQGGHVEAGDTIHDFIKFIRPEVHVIGTGWVASAGITIFLAAKKEHRYSLPNTRFMIHQPLEKVKKDTDRNFWMSPAEALDYGIVGKLITHYDELKLD